MAGPGGPALAGKEVGRFMPALLIVLVILALLALFGMFGIVGSVLGLVLTVIVAAIVGWVADLIVPGNRPYGFLGAACAGIVGCWLGVALLGSLGPTLAGIPLLSALIGAIIVTFLYALLVSRTAFGRRA
jgi:uncharacterized membrane protein YeaQ/YmgE (transglycosylase-associated protein family)